MMAGADLQGAAQTYSRNGRLHYFIGWTTLGTYASDGVYLEESSGDNDSLDALAFPDGTDRLLICAYPRQDTDPLPMLDIVARKDGSLVVTVSGTTTGEYIVRGYAVYQSTAVQSGGVYF